MALTVREATASDARSIAIVQVESWRAAYADILPSSLLSELSVDARETAWRGWIADPGSGRRYWIAEDDDRVVGYAAVGPCRDDDSAGLGEIYALYALPSVWGTGVGRALLRRATEALGDTFRGVALWVLEQNERARGFYERAGFRVDGRTKDEELGGRVVRELRYYAASGSGSPTGNGSASSFGGS